MRETKSGKFPRVCTVFALPVINDKELLNEPAVLLVHNIPDVVRLAKEGDSAKMQEWIQDIIRRTDYSQGGKNKPEGWGESGGGRDDLESMESATRRELEEETGLRVKSIRGLFHTGKMLLIDTRKKDLVASIPFRPGCIPSITAKEHTDIVENLLYFHKVEPVWDGTPMRELLLAVKSGLLKNGTTEEEIQRDGLWFSTDELTPEEISRLGVSGDGLKEIDRWGLFPAMRFSDLMSNEMSEEPLGRKSDLFVGLEDIYFTHIHYVYWGLKRALSSDYSIPPDSPVEYVWL